MRAIWATFFLKGEVLLNTKRKYTKDSSFLAGNAANYFLRRDVLLDIKGQSMKKSSILAGNATSNFL